MCGLDTHWVDPLLGELRALADLEILAELVEGSSKWDANVRTVRLIRNREILSSPVGCTHAVCSKVTHGADDADLAEGTYESRGVNETD